MSPRPKIVGGIEWCTAGHDWKTVDGRCQAWRHHDGSFRADVDLLALCRRQGNIRVSRKFKTLDNAMRAAVKACYPKTPLTVSGFALVNAAGVIDIHTVCASREQAAGHLRVRYGGKGARIHPVTVIVERT